VVFNLILKQKENMRAVIYRIIFTYLFIVKTKKVNHWLKKSLFVYIFYERVLLNIMTANLEIQFCIYNLYKLYKAIIRAEYYCKSSV